MCDTAVQQAGEIENLCVPSCPIPPHVSIEALSTASTVIPRRVRSRYTFAEHPSSFNALSRVLISHCPPPYESHSIPPSKHMSPPPHNNNNPPLEVPSHVYCPIKFCLPSAHPHRRHQCETHR